MTGGQAYIYLESFLVPLAPYLERPDVTDIWCNAPGEVWLERIDGQLEHHVEPLLTTALLARLARQIAAYSAQGISREHPLIAAALPDGSRVQLVLPPATRGQIAIAIRKHHSAQVPLEAWRSSGLLAAHGKTMIDTKPDTSDYPAFLRWAVRNRKTIMVSGGTSSGKTTLLNALIMEIDRSERLIFIEDTPELTLERSNAVGLLAIRGGQGEAQVSAEDLLIASLRLRPDRIILGEIRGGEAFTFLRAINTGHPGSLTTIHANTPQSALDQLAMLALQGNSGMTWDMVERMARATIDLIVQVERGSDGRRIVEIYESGA